MIDKALEELINFIKSITPVLWDTLLKQVYADIVTLLIWMVLTALAAFFLIRFARKRLAEDDCDMAGIFAMIGGVLSTIISPVLLTSAVRMLINPYYYAITNILSTLKGN